MRILIYFIILFQISVSYATVEGIGCPIESKDTVEVYVETGLSKDDEILLGPHKGIRIKRKQPNNELSFVESYFEDTNCIYVYDAFSDCDYHRVLIINLDSLEILSDEMKSLGSGGWCEY